ncbi:hypothetical protein SCLCIDRAFT_920752 [Scleroderma citrinum Foug A]|uniref:Uncharacterized protein n=1 Tax=Scleroderma citrinum Foug A TaxID=1036808 RepID=A0A0C3A844_9AGAM|nr:hypothetical protein SCLCIDRAFT_920752 [Scleroderma citrinum Foug A]
MHIRTMYIHVDAPWVRDLECLGGGDATGHQYLSRYLQLYRVEVETSLIEECCRWLKVQGRRRASWFRNRSPLSFTHSHPMHKTYASQTSFISSPKRFRFSATNDKNTSTHTIHCVIVHFRRADGLDFFLPGCIYLLKRNCCPALLGSND